MKILWVSRHQMSEDQKQDLQRIYNEDRIQIKQLDKTISNVEEIVAEGEDADVYAVVLPPALLSSLLKKKGDKPVIRAVSNRIPTGNTIRNPAGEPEQEYAFQHECWEEVLRVEIITKRL